MSRQTAVLAGAVLGLCACIPPGASQGHTGGTGSVTLVACNGEGGAPQGSGAGGFEARAFGAADDHGSDQIATAIAVGSCGDPFVMGTFSGSIDFGPGHLLVEPPASSPSAPPWTFLARFDGAFAPRWAQAYGGGPNRPTAMAVEADGSLLFAGTFSDHAGFAEGTIPALHTESSKGEKVFLARIDPLGQPAFHHEFCGERDHCVLDGMRAFPGGGAVVSGIFAGSLSLGATPALTSAPYDPNKSVNPPNLFVARIGADDQWKWSVNLGPGAIETSDDHTQLAIDAMGQVALSGNCRKPEPTGITPCVKHNGDNGGPFVISLDGDGNHRWHRPFTVTSISRRHVAFDPKGNLFATWSFGGQFDFGGNMPPSLSSDGMDILLVKLDDKGKPIWVEVFGGAGDQLVSSLAVDAAGSVVLTGTIGGTLDLSEAGGASPLSSLPGSGDAFVITLDLKGTLLHAERITGALTGDSPFTDLGAVLHPTGDLLLAGGFQGALSPLGVNSKGATDVLLARLAAQR